MMGEHGIKEFDKIQYHFMIKKTTNQLGIEKLFLNMMNTMYEKSNLTSFSIVKD